jgi:hypothetical protein
VAESPLEWSREQRRLIGFLLVRVGRMPRWISVLIVMTLFAAILSLDDLY